MRSASKIWGPPYTLWLIVLFLATLIAVLPFYLLFALFRLKKWSWKLTQSAARFFLFGTGLSARVQGVFPRTRCIVVANHASYLDPILAFQIIPFYFRPLAKQEIARIPLFGFVYAQVAILVKRAKRRDKAAAQKLLAETLLHECSVFIFPEGTFNETEEPTANFFAGAFKLSVQTGLPIVPVVFPDIKQRGLPRSGTIFNPGRNRAFVLDAVWPHEFAGGAAALRTFVQAAMDKKLKELSE